MPENYKITNLSDVPLHTSRGEIILMDDLDKKRTEQALQYEQQHHQLHPDGMTIAPYVNGDFISTSFEDGWDACRKEIEKEIQDYREALEKISIQKDRVSLGMDAGGNIVYEYVPSDTAKLAKEALEKYESKTNI